MLVKKFVKIRICRFGIGLLDSVSNIVYITLMRPCQKYLRFKFALTFTTTYFDSNSKHYIKQARKGLRPLSAMQGIGYLQNLEKFLGSFFLNFWKFFENLLENFFWEFWGNFFGNFLDTFGEILGEFFDFENFGEL